MTKFEAVKRELDLLETLGDQILDLSDIYIELLTLEEFKRNDCAKVDDIMEMHDLQAKMLKIAKERLCKVSLENY